jgi:hypothetical protein
LLFTRPFLDKNTRTFVLGQGEKKVILKRVSFDAWQGITLPRHWDDPDKSDPYPDEVLFDFAERIAQAMKCQEDNLARLVKG